MKTISLPSQGRVRSAYTRDTTLSRPHLCGSIYRVFIVKIIFKMSETFAVKELNVCSPK